MRKIVACLILLPLVVAEESRLKFSKEDEGKLPKAWEAARTGEGEGSVWKVVADATAPSKSGYVLAQTAEGPDRLFNLALVKESNLRDGSILVRFKAVRGKVDQGGGLLWRCQDHNNYYVCRYNPLEENFRVYKVVEGKRTQLGSKEELKVPAGEWHSMKVLLEGKRIRCEIDGKLHLEVEDETFARAGRVGLWTKADAQTHFDEMVIAPAP